jgi:hypothetical protein
VNTCQRLDAELALYVEGDLPSGQGPRLEEHLAGCPRCRAFLHGLEASQGALRGLAAEPIPEPVFAAVRARVLARTSRGSRPAPSVRAWFLVSAAAALAALALGVTWLGRPGVRGPRDADRVLARARPEGGGRAPAPARAEAAATPAPLPPRSTVRPLGPVSGTDATPARGTPTDLTPQEADQLARAVVALARVEALSDAPDTEAEGDVGMTDLPPTPSGPVVRWTTGDPGVVIYWQLAADGGDS